MAMPVRKPIPIDQSAAVLGAFIFLAVLALFAYAGSYARYWSDDYCYSYFARDNHLPASLWNWYVNSGNRFSTLLPVTIGEWFGPRAIRFTPAVVLAVWAWAWVFFLARLAAAFGWLGPRRWLVLLGLVQVFFCVLLAPDRLQTVYWRMGVFHYTFPLALLLFNLGWLAGRWKQGGSGWFALGSGLLAFFAAGFSETYAAFQTGVFGLLLLGGMLIAVRRRAGFGRAAGWAAGALIGSLFGMAALALAPSNAMRQAVLPPPDNLLDVVTYSLRYAADFSWYSLRGQPLPTLVFIALVTLAAFLAAGGAAPRLSLRRAVAGIVISLAAGYLLIVCCMAPSAYGALLYPPGRALMVARFALLLSLGSAAVFAGLAARGLFPERRWQAVQVLAALLLLAGCIYPLRALAPMRQEVSLLAVKAARWDERDAQILAQRSAGIRDVLVRETDVVQTLEDLSPSKDFWVNSCASRYYQVDSITAQP
jgi:hypothetical protein